MPTDSARDAAFVDRWKATRAKGYRHFVLVSGMLAWGLPMFLVMTFMNARGLTVRGVLVAAAIWSIAGITFGVLVWYASERRYRKLTAAVKPPDDPSPAP